MTHVELSYSIIKNLKKLEPVIGLGKLNATARELRISDVSIIDLILTINYNPYRLSDKIILELKSDNAKHDIIGQILKYKHDLKLHPYSHNNIYYIAIAKDYDDFTKKELWNNGFRTIVYDEYNEITFTEIYNDTIKYSYI